ncbi:transglycosylase domain-containing protein [Catenuloplanes atrovinosus]|uniref:Membrane peptidoglycan carboxypeptidase n=1 Tax=Catenuloplanes atrovinosus TaxID=137266 RepID=A0AAE3YI80_9ACTN|nr:transglycosylase domain-containing protein [Catenuloplanes atrovinosus]MDR7273935.1 membrane peptidoglycan carboxypeptidase [Catenuloplanes atrovinosus]
MQVPAKPPAPEDTAPVPQAAPGKARTILSISRKVLTLGMLGLVGGAVVAGAALPASATAGLAAKLASDSFEDLPSALQTPPTAQTSYLYANDGKTQITQFYEENRTDVESDDIAKVMKDAIVAAEDTRFYVHGGVDIKGLVRAFVSNAQGGEVSQGASTLTMQYVRNVLKNDPTITEEERKAATEQTTGRKLQEIRYAVTIEDSLEKEEILRRYLNIAYFGNQAYGISAAANAYFSTTADKLTLGQAATIAGLVQSPDLYDPVNNDEDGAITRRNYVLGAMVGTGAITQAEADKALAEPLNLKPNRSPGNCTAVPEQYNNWGFFCDYFTQWWSEQEEFGSTPSARLDALKKGGFRIVTSMDPAIQNKLADESKKIYALDNPKAAPYAAVEPATGKVKALAINRRYSIEDNPGGKKYPNTVNQLIAGSEDSAGYQWGSTFKGFVMLAALENGIALDKGFTTKSPYKSIYPISGTPNCGGYWCPGNAVPSYQDGYQNMWTGFGKSSNTYFVKLEETVGADKAVEMAKRLGIKFRGSDADFAEPEAAKSWGTFTLGVSATTPLQMANAYATLAADGKYCQPTPVVSITDTTGTSSEAAAKVSQPDCVQAIDKDVARAAADAGRCPVGQRPQRGTCSNGTSTQVAGIMGNIPITGKTGTASANETVSFIGVTPKLAIAGIAVNPDNPRDAVGDAIHDSIINAAARTLRDAAKGQKMNNFPAPSEKIAFKSGSASNPERAPAPQNSSRPGNSGGGNNRPR